LVKFDIDPTLQNGRIEAAYADMARDAGLDVPETRLLETGGAAHFLSRRFDRTAQGERLHLHSYSGLTHTPLRDGLEYGDLIDITRMLTRDQRAVDEIFRRAAFNVLAANDDDHGRNHAFLMDPEGNWMPAPAYDLTLATNPLGSGFRAARVNGRSIDVSPRDLMRLGSEHDVRSPAQIIQEVRDAVAAWPTHAARYAINRANLANVAAQHRISS
jgi:serine/threonine-protein kinase HipA